MKMIFRLAAFSVLAATPLPAIAAPVQALMYKNPSCSCCETYAAYLEQNGFKLEIKPTNDLAQISAELGVPAELQGCHSVVIGDYVVDGFVPVGQINDMIAKQPAIVGIAVVGMPTGSPGSPGMPGAKREPFKIYAFTKDGKAPTVYAVQ